MTTCDMATAERREGERAGVPTDDPFGDHGVWATGPGTTAACSAPRDPDTQTEMHFGARSACFTRVAPRAPLRYQLDGGVTAHHGYDGIECGRSIPHTRPYGRMSRKTSGDLLRVPGP